MTDINTRTVRKADESYGESVVPEGVGPLPAKSPAEMPRDELGRLLEPTGKDPFHFGATEASPVAVPSLPTDPRMEPLPAEKRGKLPAARTE